MAGDNTNNKPDDQTEGQTEEDNKQTEGNKSENNDDNTTSVDKLAETKAQELLKPVKAKLDTAFAERDELKKKLEALEKKERDRELEELRTQGKHKEAADREIAEAKARADAAERQVIELTRDNELRTALAGHPFRNANALEMAFKDLSNQLVRNEAGKWVHKTNVTISDAVRAYVADDDNAFLLKQKTSSGGGSSSTSKPGSPSSKGKSMKEMSLTEVLAAAEKGELPHQQRRR